MTTLANLYWKFVVARTRVGRLPSAAVLAVIELYAVFQIMHALDLPGAYEDLVLMLLAACAGSVAASFFTFREGLMLSVGWWPRIIEVHASRSFFVERTKPEAMSALNSVIRDARVSGIQIVTLETPLFASRAVLSRYARRIFEMAQGQVLSYHTSLEYASWWSMLLFVLPRLPLVRRFSKIEERVGRLQWHDGRLLCGRMELRLRPPG